MVRVRRVDAPLLPSSADDVLGIANFVLHRRDFELGRRTNYGREPFDQPDVRAPYFSLPLVVGGLLLRPISFGAEPQVLVRRRVGEPARRVTSTQ